MLKRILDNFRKGVEKARWFSRLFAERLKVEVAVFRLLYESDKKTKTREEILIKIGERVLELKDRHDKNILKDTLVSGAIEEIGRIENELGEIKGKVSEISRVAD